MKAVAGVTALRRFARPRAAPVERCSGCGAPLSSSHEHRLEARERRLACVCLACATVHGAHAATWKVVPKRVVVLRDFEMTPGDWERLALPIRLAFFVVSSVDDRAHVFFPSPAGATEAELDTGSWADLRARSPVVAAMKSDVESLLVHHVGAAREHFLVSIDVSYRLVGTLRRGWRGFSGGPEVWAEIDRLMTGIRREGGAGA
jgi:hypothetical protein